MPSGLHSKYRNTASVPIPGNGRGFQVQVEVSLEQERTLQEIHLRGKQLCYHLGHTMSRLHSFGGISGEKKRGWVDLCHAPLRESQHRPPGFWRKAMPSATELHAFWKTTSDVVLGPGRNGAPHDHAAQWLVMGWILSIPVIRSVGPVTVIVRSKQYIWYQTHAGPESTSR